MNYTAAVREFFASPRWGMNLLLGGVCNFIPIVGPMALTGWLITGFWARNVSSGAAFPDFEFDQFAKYMERGLWPFLAVLVVTFVMVPVFWVVMFVPIFGAAIIGGQRNAGCLVLFGWLISICLFVLVILAMALLLTPIKLRASLTQNFGQAFNLAFIKRFVALTWKEIVISWLFLLVVNLGFMMLGMLVFCVGTYFVIVPMYFALMHITKQLYNLYLARGGEPVPISPKLAVA